MFAKNLYSVVLWYGTVKYAGPGEYLFFYYENNKAKFT